MKRHQKGTCILCGRILPPGNLKRHINSRPCRQEQIEQEMARRGFYPLFALHQHKTLRKARVPFFRFPAYQKNNYRQDNLWRNVDGQPRLPGFFEPEIFRGLGDRLFVPDWVLLLLRAFPPDKKGKRPFMVALLMAVNDQDEEFKQDLVSAHALNAYDGIEGLLEHAGILS